MRTLPRRHHPAAAVVAVTTAGALLLGGCSPGEEASADAGTDTSTGTSTAGTTRTAAPAPPPSPAPTTAPGDGTVAGEGDPDGPRVAFLGDSLTVGVGAPAGRSYAWQTAELLGWPVAVVDGVNGSGWTVPGSGGPFEARVPDVVAARPDVVLVVGGNNDAFRGASPDAVRVAAREVLAELTAALPEADVVVVGPFPTGRPDLPDERPVSDAVRAAAEEVGVPFLDPAQMLATELADPAAWDRHLSPDRVHPDESGYTVIARALAEELPALTDAA